MTRLAFLVAHPEHQDAVPANYDYVVIDGHCRLRAARKAGIDLRITVDDSSAGTREDLLAAALSANHFRKDLTPIEEAEAIEALVAFHGSAAAVVSVLGGAVNNSWISTRRALLKLPEPIQERVAAKEVPIEIARKAGSLPREEQTAFVEAKMAQRDAEQAVKPKPVRGRAAAAMKKTQSQQPRRRQLRRKPCTGRTESWTSRQQRFNTAFRNSASNLRPPEAPTYRSTGPTLRPSLPQSWSDAHPTSYGR
ncbi:ParB/RepB/Spo0J family partition protein [Streptomyces sp. NPDC005899]|uniref:ParB/RepB/Spo0J family partition protein n=1 Tax=Streptomyces sp. NPDC005899 TaxID=3155716 RepID=UPI0033F02564